MQAIKSPITDYELFKSKTVSGSFISFEAYELQIELNANGIVKIILTKKGGKILNKNKKQQHQINPYRIQKYIFSGSIITVCFDQTPTV